MKHFLPAFLILLVGCSYFQKQTTSEPEKAPWLPAFDSAALSSVKLSSERVVRDFYEARDFEFFWIDSAKLLSVGDSLVHFIAASDDAGLIPDDYHAEEIHGLKSSTLTPALAAQLDILLTDAIFTMRFHITRGRITKKKFGRIDYSNVEDSAASMSVNRLKSEGLAKTIRSFEPQIPVYQRLKEKLAELNDVTAQDSVIIKQRIQLIANLERWRTQKEFGDRYIAVNVPSFMLHVFENDTLRLDSKVIIGKPETPTPELESTVKQFIIYPYWHVPRSILKEILPSIQQDSLYLRKHNYQVLDRSGTLIDATSLDWKSFTPEDFPYVLRQREGSENTMGVLKFVFANNYNVYLHDTNARRLFSKEDRALSHGCVRVHKAVQLAHFLAKDDDTYVSPEDLDQYLLLQRRLEVAVVKPIKLYLLYFTCVEENGEIVFYEDIYKKDRQMFDSLTVKPQQYDFINGTL